MPPEAGGLADPADTSETEASARWRAALTRAGLAVGALLLLFAGDGAAMLRQWWNISTYNHILLVPLIIAWLVWQRRAQLARLEPGIWPLWLVPFAGAAFLWLLGALSGLDLARQAGTVAMLAAAIPLLMGRQVAAGLAFPIAYMAFLVPAGGELVTVLQTLTARMTATLVQASGIPARIDGVFIRTPAGLFEVAEACSGVKFLIAMVAFGALMANLCFVSPVRRAALMVACVVVPILANGIRAWGTVYAAQLFGIEAAAGFDHIVYGWFFFAIVMALLIAIAWPFFDRKPDRPAIDADAIVSRSRARGDVDTLSPALALASLFAVIAVAQGWALLGDRLHAAIPARVDLPPVEGWTRVDYRPTVDWQPLADGADHRLLGSYAKPTGEHVDVFYALYSAQRDGQEAGGFGEGALPPNSAWAWQAPATAPANGRGDRLLGAGRTHRTAVTWYRSGPMLTGSNARLKLAVMGQKLSLRPRVTSLLIVSAEDGPGASAQASINSFVDAVAPIGPWLDRIAEGR